MLSQNIKNLRKQKGYTQETFAQELNVVRQTVSKWEKGYSVPDAVMLERIAELLEVPVGDLLGEPAQAAEEKPDLKQIAEQLSILNNQIAKEFAAKRKRRKIALAVLAAVCALGLALLIVFSVSSRAEREIEELSTSDSVRLPDALDAAVRDTIRSHAAGSMGEFAAASYHAYGTEEKNGAVTVYLMEEYASFGFYNGFFTDVGGGRIPAVYTFAREGGGWRLTAENTARDGDVYASSIRALFPSRYAQAVLRGLSREQSAAIWSDLVSQARAYLAAIGRGAEVCAYGDIVTEFLSDYGVPNEACDKMDAMRMGYDMYVGNHETLENGVRYVYQTEYDFASGCVTFTKFEYETGAVAEFIAANAQTGEPAPDVPAPETAEYRMGKRK